MTTEQAEPSHANSPPPRGRSPSALQLWGRMAGALGLVFWASAPLTYLLAETGPLLGSKLLLGLMLLIFYVATNRDFMRRSRGARSNALLLLSVLSSAMAVTLVVGLNVLVAKNDVQHDCTREKIYTLSAQTTEALHKLERPVEVFAFYSSQEPTYAFAEEALARYARESKLLSVTLVDPQSRPDLVKKYNITERGARIVLACEGRDARAKSAGEEELTEALLKVVESSHKTVAFLVGHGEGDTKQSEEAEGFASFADAVAADGYKVETLNLQTDGSAQAGGNEAAPVVLEAGDSRPLLVPPHIDVLVVVAPVHKLLLPEVQAIEGFLRRGGRLMVLAEARSQSGLEGLLAGWHVEVCDDMVVDTNPIGRLMGLGVASPIVQPTSFTHPILRGVNGVIMSTARSLKAAAVPAGDITITPLMETSETAWGETQLTQGTQIAKDEHDHLPPLYTAMAAERAAVAGADATPTAAATATTALGRLVVFGDSDWASNRLLRLQSNEDLALNALGWLTEQEAKVTIRPNVRAQNQLYLRGAEFGTLKFLSMDILPVLLVALGLGIVMWRQQR